MKIIYVAHCIEHGEHFVTLFQTTETNKNKLLEMGHGHAIEWGGECASVRKWKPKVTKMARLFDKINNKTIENTQRKIENFMKKNPNNTRYDYSKIEYFTETEPTPIDVWDNDLTTEENLENYKKREGINGK